MVRLMLRHDQLGTEAEPGAPRGNARAASGGDSALGVRKGAVETSAVGAGVPTWARWGSSEWDAQDNWAEG